MTKDSKKMSFQDKLRERAESVSQEETFKFEENEVYAMHIDSFSTREFTRQERTWVSRLYRATQQHFDDKGKITLKEPVSFWGNTVLDGELEKGQLYIIIYKGKSKGYHDYQICAVNEETLKELASA